MSHCGLLAALTIILYGAPATFLCDSVTLISACSSSSLHETMIPCKITVGTWKPQLKSLSCSVQLFVI